MIHQEKQKERFEKLIVEKIAWRDALLKKSRHVEEMFNNYRHSMVETTTWSVIFIID